LSQYFKNEDFLAFFMTNLWGRHRNWAKGVFCKGLVEKLWEMRSLMRVNLLNLLMADGEGIFI